MMHLYQNEVRQIDGSKHRVETSEWHRRPCGDHLSFGWRSEDFDSSGVIGPATSSLPETGKILLGRVLSKFVEAVVFADSFDAPFLTEPPSDRDVVRR